MKLLRNVSVKISFEFRQIDLVLLGTKYFGRHFSVTSKIINVNQALTSSQDL
jgi:hypothetical protein